MPPTTTSTTSRSVADTILDQIDPPPPPTRSTEPSPNPPAAGRPAGGPQQRPSTSPGLQVGMSTKSRSWRPYPRFLAASFATFTSPRTFLVPDGPQSEPRQTFTF